MLRVTLSDARGGIEGVAVRAPPRRAPCACHQLRRGALFGPPPAQQSEEVAIPGELLRGTCQQLFAFIAARLVAFTGAAAEGALGFTFSFACKQTALDAGTLLGWTKGFALVDGPGLDVVALLRAALADAGSRLRVAALVNDTVGTLAAARYADPSACVAVILGTGARPPSRAGRAALRVAGAWADRASFRLAQAQTRRTWSSCRSCASGTAPRRWART